MAASGDASAAEPNRLDQRRASLTPPATAYGSARAVDPLTASGTKDAGYLISEAFGRE